MKIRCVHTVLILGSVFLVAASISGCQQDPADIIVSTEPAPVSVEGTEKDGQMVISDVENPEPTSGVVAFMLTSEAFQDRATIPTQFTCDGKDISPPLSWSGVPAGTNSFSLIMDDPDAPAGTWAHWVLVHLPGDIRALPENLQLEAAATEGIKQGTNSWGRSGYRGPCPPSGTHRYSFKLYALDGALTLDEGTTKDDVLAAMEGHILMETELVGTYSAASD